MTQLIDEVIARGEQCVMTFIDYTTAFDSVSHKFLDEALAVALEETEEAWEQQGGKAMPQKCRAMFRAIYASACARVRVIDSGGGRVFSDQFPVKRGVVQGDIFSPWCFIIALELLMRRHGRPVDGCAGEEQEGEGMVWSVIEAVVQRMLLYADDADLIDRDASSVERRVNALSDGSECNADMVISIKKTEVMHVRCQDRVSATTLEDYAQFDLAHKCVCGYSFDTYHQLAIHAARWCKKAKFERETCDEEHAPERVLNATGPPQHRWYVVQWEGYESVF